MTHGNTTVQAHKWLFRPLCRRYLLVIFESLPIYVEEGGVVYGRPLHWALGALADGQYEVSGVWSEPVSNLSNWEEIFKDLRVRGVEKIRFVLNGESVALDSVLSTAYPGAVPLPAVWKLGSLVGLPLRHRCMALKIEAAMQQLQFRASRAIRRYGCFSDPEEARAFAMDILAHAQQKSGGAAARVAVAPRQPLLPLQAVGTVSNEALGR
jgi:hypothetical protein